MDKKITVLDGSSETRDKIMKEFFDLKPEQTFQDIEIDEDDED